MWDPQIQEQPTAPVPSAGMEGADPMATELLARLPEWERQADDYERKAQALRQIIAGVQALNGEAHVILAASGVRSDSQHRAERGPRGRTAVLALMSERPAGDEWEISELKDEIVRREWAPSPKAVEVAVRRTCEDGDVEAIGDAKRGLYRLVVDRDDDQLPIGVRRGMPVREEERGGGPEVVSPAPSDVSEQVATR